MDSSSLGSTLWNDASTNEASWALDSVESPSSLGSTVGPGGSAGSGASSVVGPEPRSGVSTIPVSPSSVTSSPAAATPWPMAPARMIVAATAPTTIAVLELSRGGAPAGLLLLTEAGVSATSSFRLRMRVALLPARVAVPQTTQKLAPTSSGISQDGQNAVPFAASLGEPAELAPSSAASRTAKCSR